MEINSDIKDSKCIVNFAKDKMLYISEKLYTNLIGYQCPETNVIKVKYVSSTGFTKSEKFIFQSIKIYLKKLSYI